MVSERPTMTRVDGLEPVIAGLETGVRYVLVFVKWLLLLNIAVGWLFVWGNLARHHLSRGDPVAVGLTLVLLVVPLVVGGWWIVRD